MPWEEPALWSLTGLDQRFAARLLCSVGSSVHFSWSQFLHRHQESESEVAQSCPTLCDPVGCAVHGILQARTLEWVAFPFSRGSSQPRDQTQVSRIAGRFFTKPKNIGVGSLSLLRWIFPTQELNLGLPHCRRILYQLSYQGSP